MAKVGDKFPAIPSSVSGVTADEFPTATPPGEGLTVLFEVPGAFTPTCHAKHLPGFVANEEQLHAAGVKRIICVGANDKYVMRAWAATQGDAKGVEYWADGSTELADALGMRADYGAFGMGTRSKRWAAIVKDGELAFLAVDAGGEFGATSAEMILQQVAKLA